MDVRVVDLRKDWLTRYLHLLPEPEFLVNWRDLDPLAIDRLIQLLVAGCSWRRDRRRIDRSPVLPLSVRTALVPLRYQRLYL